MHIEVHVVHHVGTRLRRLGGTEPVIEIGPNQVNEPYVSLSNVLFDQNYGPIGDGSQFGGTDALIFINSGNLRMEDSSFPQNPHKYAVAVKDPASRVYAQPQVSVQVCSCKKPVSCVTYCHTSSSIL